VLRLFWFLPLASIAASWTPRERAIAGSVTESALRAHVRFLASDATEGRAPGSRGDDLAMQYVVSQFERVGLQPGAGGEWLQRFDIVGLSTKVAGKPSLYAGKSRIELHPGDDSVIAAGAQTSGARVDAEMVFVGYGITAPEQKWDDYAGTDVRGKVVVVMNNDPESDPSLFAGKTRLYYGRWTYKFEEAARHGAAAAIIIHTTPSAGYPWQVVQTSWSGEEFELPSTGEPRVQVRAWVTEDIARKLFALGGKNLETLRAAAEQRGFRAVPLGAKFSVAVETTLRKLQTANVLGVLPGSDPTLAKEMVIYSAHHDHLGVRQQKGGDAIYNGALDNASGVAALVSLAEAISRAEPRPRRSVLFAAVGGEESGLLGSKYLCQHPPVPAGRIAANVNIDGINIFGRTRDAEFIGYGKSTLDSIVDRAVAEQGRVVVPDQFPDRGGFYRSDQFSFARIGVPAVYLKGGVDVIGKPPGWGKERIEEYTRTRYHQPSDELTADWDFAGAVDDVRLLAVIGLRIADDAKLPAWRPGDEFEAARKAAAR
jgi:Zn-dependent M28 family amino/carboxypeptidase